MPDHGIPIRDSRPIFENLITFLKAQKLKALQLKLTHLMVEGAREFVWQYNSSTHHLLHY